MLKHAQNSPDRARPEGRRLPGTRRLVAIVAALVCCNFVFGFGAGPTPAATTPVVSYSVSSARTAAVALSNATVKGQIYVFASSAPSSSTVSFWIDDPNRTGAPYRTDNVAPYDLVGSSGNAALVFDTSTIADGKHTVTMKVARAWQTTYSSATFTVSNSVEQTLFGSLTPAVAADPDAKGTELGVRFKSDVDGVVTGVRFYKSTTNVGTHIGNVWSDTGTLLARTTFTNETASGWQIARFSSPLAVTAGRTYIVSYYTPSGHYAGDTQWFTGKGQNSGPLHAPADSSGAPNGLYKYGSSSAFPTSTWQGANYFVDVLFIDTTNPGSANPGADPSTTTTTTTTPAPTTTTTAVPQTTTTTPPPPTTAPPPVAGWPNASNTGVQVATTRTLPGAAITSTAWFAQNGFPGSGTQADPFLVDRVLFTDQVALGDWNPTDLTGKWVKFTNSRFYGNAANPTPAGSSFIWARDYGPFFIVEDSTLAPNQPPLATGGTTIGTQKGIFSYVPFQVRRSNIYGTNVAVGFETERNETTGIVIEDNYFHDVWSASGDHTDLVNGNFHASHVIVRHNMLDGIRVGGSYVTNALGIYDNPTTTLAGTIEDWTVDNNYIDRSATMLLATSNTSHFLGPFVVTNNVFTNRYTVGRFIARPPTTQGGNVDQNGAPLSF